MIEFLKENYPWLGVIAIPIIAAIIKSLAVIFKKSGRNQKIGNITGDGNTIINGDVNIKK